ncbi:nucleotidyl transferase family protein [Candidatus Phytoplasma sacchari]|nr:hypothetical protein [Candidatus Phytoplasma sacchari]KAB8122155.1 hypothetical protein F2B49_01840 [Candidatus Phytoplasma sacchari]
MNFINLYSPKIVDFNDYSILKKIEKILKEEDLKKDLVEEYAVIFSNDKNEIAAFIGRYANNLRCLVVKKKFRQYNISNILVDFMSKRIYKLNFREIFVFTKFDNLNIFENLGFKSIFHNDKFCFLTNRYDLFEKYLDYLSLNKIKLNHYKINTFNSVIVMNSNPFTKGHYFLIQNAIKQSQFVYIILVREELSLFTYEQRREMVKLGIKDLKNVKIIEGSNYLISKNVFPSYFFKSQEESSLEQMHLDSFIFSDFIAPRLDVKRRFVGSEPFSRTTELYNNVMKKIFLNKGLELIIIPRILFKTRAISATIVRKLFIKGEFQKIKKLVPLSTFNFLKNLNYLEYRKNPNLLKFVNKDF